MMSTKTSSPSLSTSPPSLSRSTCHLLNPIRGLLIILPPPPFSFFNPQMFGQEICFGFWLFYFYTPPPSLILCSEFQKYLFVSDTPRFPVSQFFELFLRFTLAQPTSETFLDCVEVRLVLFLKRNTFFWIPLGIHRTHLFKTTALLRKILFSSPIFHHFPPFDSDNLGYADNTVGTND